MISLSFFSSAVLCLWTLSAESSPTLTKRAAAPVSTACGDIVRAAVNTTLFDASLAYECLTSVPFNPAVSTRFIKYYNDSIQFQSTLSYLKNPPPSYQQPAVDLVGGLERIQTQINNGAFENQYVFETTLQSLIYSTHDAHLDLVAGILGVFSFGARYGISSVSVDGIQLPKVYLTDHLLESQSPSTTWEPSAISTIDGRNVIDFLTHFAAWNSIGGLEGHTDWNQLMDSPAHDIQSGFSTWGGAATFYPGDVMTIVLENGTKIPPTPWRAIYYGEDITGTGPLETGGDFYNFHVLGLYPASYVPPSESDPEANYVQDPATQPTSVADPSASPTATQASWNHPAYPSGADIAEGDLGTYGGGFLSGYFLNESSIAVLSLPSFQELGDNVDVFSATVGDFIATSKAAGMKKIVIDLQQNYGGDALLAFDTFKQFFPEIKPYGGSRMRAHSPANVMGDAITSYWDSLSDVDDYYYYLIANEWNALNRVDADTKEDFTSWEQFYGPSQHNGDSFTTVQQYNLSDYLFDSLSLEAYNDGFMVYGYGNRSTNTTHAYAAKDIIMLTDALCSSTCSLFMEMMHCAGVKSVVTGGRPSYGPMQAPGLTRGARAYGITSDLDADIELAQNILKLDNKSSDFLPNRTEALGVFVISSGLNLRDQVRKGEDVPLQFVYEAADCRIFLTPKTFYNYTALWKYAADAIWGNPKLCVQDSTGYSTTNKSDTKGPPAAVVPAPITVKQQELPTNLGAVIMSMFSSSPPTGIEAQDQRVGSGPTPLGKLCSQVDTTMTCPGKYVCYGNYSTTCVKQVATKVPGCVLSCRFWAEGQEECGTGFRCRPRKTLPTNFYKTFDWVPGYCKPTQTYTCGSSIKNVLPGEAPLPGKKKSGRSLLARDQQPHDS